MARIVVCQHNDHAHAGRLGRTLRDHGFRVDVRRPDLDPDSVPADLDDVHGVLILGGKQNVDEGHPFLAREQALIRAAHNAQKPVVGICLGAQQIGVALGGKVERMARPEVGLAPVHLTVPGQTETILAGIPWSCPQLHSHAYEVTKLPPGSTLLGSTPACRHQAFRLGLRTFAFQYHFECDLAMTREMFAWSARLAEEAGVTRDDLDAQFDRHAEMFDRAAERLSTSLTTLAFTFDELLAV